MNTSKKLTYAQFLEIATQQFAAGQDDWKTVTRSSYPPAVLALAKRWRDLVNTERRGVRGVKNCNLSEALTFVCMNGCEAAFDACEKLETSQQLRADAQKMN